MTNKLWGLKKGTSSLDEYLREIKGICDALVAIRKPVSDLDKVLVSTASKTCSSLLKIFFLSININMQ